MYGSIGDQIKRKASRIEMATETEYNFKSQKLDNILEDKNHKGGEVLKIKSKSGKTKMTLDTQRDQVIESLKLLAVCHE